MRIESQRVTCKKCKTVSDIEIVVDCPVAVYIASSQAAQCPQCGAGSESLGMGGAYDDAPPLTAKIEDRAAWWIMRGEVGASSETIYSVLAGARPPKHGAGTPLDPDDYRRCKLLLDLIPEWRPQLGRVAEKYSEWKKLVENWDRIAALFDEEAPSGRCPKCYRLIQECLK